jgi:hypothetical protein
VLSQGIATIAPAFLFLGIGESHGYLLGYVTIII